MQTKALFIANRGSVHVDQSLCFIRTVTVQRKLSDVRADFFQIACVRFIKAVRCITVYIQHSDDVSFFYNRYYYLLPGIGTAGYVTGKQLYIRNNQRLRFLPCRAANSSAETNACTGDGTLKRC